MRKAEWTTPRSYDSQGKRWDSDHSADFMGKGPYIGPRRTGDLDSCHGKSPVGVFFEGCLPGRVYSVLPKITPNPLNVSTNAISQCGLRNRSDPEQAGL